MNFSMEGLSTVLPEGLPTGMTKEFEESMKSALLVRQSFLELRDNFRRIVDPPMWPSDGKGPKVRKQIVLDGPVSCGKSIALAMLVHWARDEGWLVFYSPKGKEWTHGGFFYKNPETGLWDTPVQAAKILQVNAFRTMMHDDMMVGAFSHSTVVGKLRNDLPDVPLDARVNFGRYSLDEAQLSAIIILGKDCYAVKHFQRKNGRRYTFYPVEMDPK